MLLMSDYREQFVADCLRDVPELAGHSVLVVGCGSGEDCRPFVEAGAASVVGMDICDTIGAAWSHPTVSYVTDNIEGSGLESGMFDLVFCLATMEHVHRIDLAFPEMLRLARRGGFVYSVAAPLWNSRQGHHMKCFEDFPWIHLRAGREDLLRVAGEHELRETNGNAIGDVIEFMYSSYFNRLPASRYVEVCSRLEAAETTRNCLWQEDESFLTQELAVELGKKGFTREELLSVSHTLVARR